MVQLNIHTCVFPCRNPFHCGRDPSLQGPRLSRSQVPCQLAVAGRLPLRLLFPQEPLAAVHRFTCTMDTMSKYEVITTCPREHCSRGLVTQCQLAEARFSRYVLGIIEDKKYGKFPDGSSFTHRSIIISFIRGIRHQSSQPLLGLQRCAAFRRRRSRAPRRTGSRATRAAITA